jgi:hypothetical protein
MNPPAEFIMGDVLLPPMLIVVSLALLLSVLFLHLFSRFRLSRLIYSPPLILLAMMTLITLFLDRFLLPI